MLPGGVIVAGLAQVTAVLDRFEQQDVLAANRQQAAWLADLTAAGADAGSRAAPRCACRPW